MIKIADKQFKYSKIQVALLSPIAFKHFLHHENPFAIEIPSHLNSNDLVSCFEQLDSLFYSTNELKIPISNVTLFSYLADSLDNRFLMKKCKKVHSNENQIFKLSSKQLICFPKSWLNHLIDFDIVVNNTKISINFSLFSCIYDKFQELDYQESELSISITNESLNCFVSFFDIMKGYSFCFENIDFSNLKR
jgi:hypothetical protein